MYAALVPKLNRKGRKGCAKIAKNAAADFTDEH
jgi:hypothetical protein